ncbi:protein O-linked-mannose beta-1,2-N-acetylglucosaminyltransferase 1-like isoform X2 [Macrobrachium nipponense]|uniref:protein O-linked-mannose beta-1,2-N-acetylglucosaminyltransferase 1-like isoform X2 n=1 Tax=Macrobrachium nipponense TaxID=159736 RepID=UPI0030C827F3
MAWSSDFSSCLWTFPLKLLLVVCVAWRHLASGNILFQPSNNDHATIRLKMDDPNGVGPPQTIVLQVETRIMEKLGLSKGELENGKVEPDEKGQMGTLKVKGMTFDLHKTIDRRTALIFHSKDAVSQFVLDQKGFLGLTLQNFENDTTLIPEAPVTLDLSPPLVKRLRTIDVIVSNSSASVLLNNITIARYEAHTRYPKDPWLEDAGLLLVAINPMTTSVTLHQIFPTSDFGAYRDFRWTLESILPGRIVVLASVHDGSLQLDPVRKYLESLGSHWSTQYLFRDSWAWVFVKGGQTLGDVIIPNSQSMQFCSSPVKLSVEMPKNWYEEARVKNGEEVPNDWAKCPGWVQLAEAHKRAVFCSTYDGFSSLCSCERPFTLLAEPRQNKTEQWREDIPIVVITGGRTRYLYRLLENIGQQDDVRKDLILLVSDGALKDVSLLAEVLGIQVMIHRPEGKGPARVSRNLRFALFSALKRFPEADKFIIMEDDLVLSPDFYSYMQQTGWLLEHDPTLYCVSGFNHLSYPHTSFDSTRLYRVDSYPSYGWMTSRAVLRDLLPKWLPSNVTHDWDHFVSSDIIRRNRECVVPDVNRSYHGGATGLHLSASYATEKDFLNRTYNTENDVSLMNLTRILQSEYETEMDDLLAHAHSFDLDEFLEGRVHTEPGEVYALFVHQKDTSDNLSFRAAGDILNIWNRDARDAHQFTWRFTYNNATVLFVGVPASKYSKHMKPGTDVFYVEEDYIHILNMEDLHSRFKVPIRTHLQSPYFRMGYQNVSLAKYSRNDTIPT